jgi:branched-subunit amino acid aminotransferase/4-amino-4-deoxychorismate lyase
MDTQCFLNGTIMPLSEAKVSLYDLGLLRGFGIYEGLISQNRKPFMFADHMARFHSSATHMQLEIPYSDAEIEKATLDLIAANIPQGKEGLIRIILTGGNAIGGIAHDPKAPTFYILVEEFMPHDEKGYRERRSTRDHGTHAAVLGDENHELHPSGPFAKKKTR